MIAIRSWYMSWSSDQPNFLRRWYARIILLWEQLHQLIEVGDLVMDPTNLNSNQYVNVRIQDKFLEIEVYNR